MTHPMQVLGHITTLTLIFTINRMAIVTLIPTISHIVILTLVISLTMMMEHSDMTKVPPRVEPPHRE
jgi:hypothetical protein